MKTKYHNYVQLIPFNQLPVYFHQFNKLCAVAAVVRMLLLCQLAKALFYVRTCGVGREVKLLQLSELSLQLVCLLSHSTASFKPKAPAISGAGLFLHPRL